MKKRLITLYVLIFLTSLLIVGGFNFILLRFSEDLSLARSVKGALLFGSLYALGSTAIWAIIKPMKLRK